MSRKPIDTAASINRESTRSHQSNALGSPKLKKHSRPVTLTLMERQAYWETMRGGLDRLVTQYKVPAYIDSDPIQFPYRYLDDPLALEAIAFITALFSYGRREQIITNLNRVFRQIGAKPIQFLEAFDPIKDAHYFQDFVHRFNTGADLIFLLERLQWAYDTHGSLENLFVRSLTTDTAIEFPQTGQKTVKPFLAADVLQIGIGNFLDALTDNQPTERYGMKFLLAHPARGGACKRFNMFLRWMVRQDLEASGKVDFGLWTQALQPQDLRIPLDAHVMNMNRKLTLSPRKDGSWKTAEDITIALRYLCPEDPVRYDYALFGFSLGKRALEELFSPG